MSVDGIHNWINTGVAFDPSTDFIRYTDGTVNHWHNMERTGVYLENGHPAAFTFAVTAPDKNATPAPSVSKIIVVPFDGVSFDADNGGETAVTGGGTNGIPAGVRGMEAGTINRMTYDLSGRAVGHENKAKPGIYLIQKADGSGELKAFIAK